VRLAPYVREAAEAFQRVPGSAVLIRYVRSSYQNDPIRSAIELVLFIFFVRYLLSPSYSTSKQNFIKLREDVSDRRTTRAGRNGPRKTKCRRWTDLMRVSNCRKSTSW
jgi:hypothetical protein